MIVRNARRIVVALLVSVMLLVTACATAAPTRFDQAQQESTQKKTGLAVAKDATQGSNFNRFFPATQAGFERVYTQEKKGFSEAKLKKGGKDVAVLSISDTQGVIGGANPSAKFQNSSLKIDGYPAVTQGKNSTALLVGDRYQVKISSRDTTFTESDRQAWLQKFNLRGIEKL
jgi:hypothetical protein